MGVATQRRPCGRGAHRAHKALDVGLIDPHDDWEEFKDLLAEAGVGDRRLYGGGGRHTAGTILNELGVDTPAVMEILRHTRISRTRRYVKGRSHLSKDAMHRMGRTFMPGPEPGPEPTVETSIETTDSRTARFQRRRRIRQKQKPQVTASES
ncbi:site-specific integrase [Streptomyces sp. IBSBF 2953]|nr:site-specific integrase [Streptomyces hayashii]